MRIIDIMVSLITPAKAQKKLAEQARARRLQMELTQEGLAERSGVALPTLRKFERTGVLSLEATQIKEESFSSIDEVLKSDNVPIRKRGTRK